MAKKYNGGVPLPTSIKVESAQPSDDRMIVTNKAFLQTLEYAYPLMKVVVESDGNTYQWIGGAQTDLNNWVDEITLLQDDIMNLRVSAGILSFDNLAAATAYWTAAVTKPEDNLEIFIIVLNDYYKWKASNGAKAVFSRNYSGNPDTVPTAGSTNTAQSGGIKNLTNAIQTNLSNFSDFKTKSGSVLSIVNAGILRIDGTINSGSSSYKTSDFITATEGTTKYITLDFGNGTGLGTSRNVAYFDESDNFIFGLILNGIKTIAVQFPYKVKVSTRNELVATATTSNTLEKITDESFKIAKCLSTFTAKKPLNGTAITMATTGILRDVGTVNTSASSYKVSDFITATDGTDKFIEVDFGNPTGLSTSRNVCYYDENDVLIVGFLLNGTRTIGVPFPYKVKIATRTELVASAIQSTSLKEYAIKTDVDTSLLNKVTTKTGKNLLDPTTVQNGKGYSAAGSLLSNVAWEGVRGATDKIYFNGETQLTVNNYSVGVGFFNIIYNASDVVISAQDSATITNVAGGVYAKFTVNLNTTPQIEYGATSTEFETYSPIAGYLDAGSNIELNAYADGVNADTETNFYGVKSGLTSIQRAINSCDEKNTYVINVFGHFKFTTSAEFFADTLSDYFYMVLINQNKKNITLQGQGMDRTILECFLPDNLTTGFNYHKYIPLELLGDNCYVKDMTISCQNMRYPVHVDKSSSNVCNDYILGFTNVRMIHKGNTGDALTVWSSNSPLGLGISSGMDLTIDGCELVCHKDSNPFYVHDNHSFTKPFYFRIKNTKGISLGEVASNGTRNAFTFQILGANVAGNVILENVDFTGRYQFYYDNGNIPLQPSLADYDPRLFVRITGNVNIPLLHLPINSKGRVLKITSNTTGGSSTVRFDENSTAFPILVGGVNSVDYTERNGIVHVDGYNYNDGAESFNGYARGELALDINSAVDLSARLGDRTSTPITLGIIIDGITYNVVFNTYYTTASDQDVLDVINTAISGFGVATLYDWGSDYHAEFPQCMSEAKNFSTYTIKNGMGIKLANGGIYPAENNSEVHAIALDDIKPNYWGRYATKELLYTFDSNRFFIKLATQGSVAKGTKFSIGSNRGIFIADNANGILEAKYSSVVEVNF